MNRRLASYEAYVQALDPKAPGHLNLVSSIRGQAHYLDCQWTYEQRREKQEILPNLFLGPYATAKKDQLPTLEQDGITHIVCVRHVMEKEIIKPHHVTRIKYLVVEVNHGRNRFGSVMKYHRMVNDFIRTAIHQEQGRVLIHGNTGTSLSMALALAYMMEATGWSASLAKSYLSSKRAAVAVMPEVVKELEELEPIFAAKRGPMTSPYQSDRISKKRSPSPSINEF